MTVTPSVDNNETVVRILHKDWVVDGQLQVTAFALRQGESYISVNRPVIDTFSSDVYDFVSKHADYKVSDEGALIYRQAGLNVSAVRNIKVELGQLSAEVSVEVEPRDAIQRESYRQYLTSYSAAIYTESRECTSASPALSLMFHIEPAHARPLGLWTLA